MRLHKIVASQRLTFPPPEFTLGPRASADPGVGRVRVGAFFRHAPPLHTALTFPPPCGRGIAYEKSNTGGQKFDSVVAPSGFAGFENCRSKPVPIRKFLGQLRPSIRNPICDSPAPCGEG